MKKNIFLSMLAATLLLATSCSQTDDLLQPTSIQETVTFTARIDEGSMNLRSASTRAATDATDEVITRAVLEIYDASSTLVGTRLTGTISGETITFASVQLEVGATYTCNFWADGGENAYDITDLTAIARGTSPSIAYYASEEVTVEQNTSTTNVILTHAVAKVILWETGTLASGDKVGVAFTVPEYTFSVASGESTETEDEDGEEIDKTFTISSIIADNVGHLYLFTPAAGADPVTVTLSYTAEGAVDAETMELSNVPLRVNHRTLIRGKFEKIVDTTNTQAFNVTLNTDWGDDNEIDTTM